MAFVLQQSWHGADDSAFPGPRPESRLLGPLLEGRTGETLRRGGGTLLTIAVHALLLWVLATRLVGEPEVPEAPPPPIELLQFDLMEAAPAPAAAEAPAQAPSAPQPVVAQSELDPTTPTEIPPPEWTVSRIALAIPESRGTGSAPVAAGGGAGAGAGGSGVYDPYAGAAPLPLERPGAGSGGALALDLAALDALRRRVERALAACAGTVVLAVKVAPTGIVMDAAVRGGTASPAAKTTMRNALLGKQLFRGAAGRPEDRQLPEIAFCA